ncbi:DgyrCDS9161 [Dimorphilus gyrociliatus]|uniref:GDP-D-glucose phosphorylase 1 n=1 Tax=Dimorphilus gyrociliatus TaxID=2664684 RepID=A0A7I8VXQ4_9ANNE|nr:DgyrCDS9161 [Dimorphilus gyrociliatus]
MLEFEFSEKDLNFECTGWRDLANIEETLTKFDRALFEKWREISNNGILMYKLDDLEGRCIGDRYKFQLQLNPERVKKRKGPTISQINIPFDPNRFHFGKVRQEEILFKIKDNLIIINIYPLDIGHVLLVPSIDRQLPQSLNDSAVLFGVECLLLSGHPGCTVGFNSLGALASVNHLHMHMWFVRGQLPISSVEVREIEGTTLSMGDVTKDDYVVRLVAFQMINNDVNKFVELITASAQYLQKKEIAHNIILVKGSNFSKNGNTIRAFVWPRQSILGEPKNPINHFVAVAEVAGHVTVYNEEFYRTAKEELMSESIREPAFEDKVFDEIRNGLVNTVKKIL